MRNRKGFQGTIHGLIEVLSRYMPGGAEVNKKNKADTSVLWSKFKLGPT
jgi:hypothetical protein